MRSERKTEGENNRKEKKIKKKKGRVMREKKVYICHGQIYIRACKVFFDTPQRQRDREKERHKTEEHRNRGTKRQ